jgi:hypothetical protein
MTLNFLVAFDFLGFNYIRAGLELPEKREPRELLPMPILQPVEDLGLFLAFLASSCCKHFASEAPQASWLILGNMLLCPRTVR